MTRLKAKLCALLILVLVCTACETREEYYAKQAAPCRTFCHQHGGFFGVSRVETGGFVNVVNLVCVCNDGTTIPRPN